MTDLNQSLKDNGNPQKYYAVIEHMADDDLDLYEYRLYGHYKRICGQEGACWESVRTTAKKCGMSAGSVCKARRGLEEKGYITYTVAEHKHENGNIEVLGGAVELVDTWLKNVQRYANFQPQGCSPHEQGVHQVNVRSNHKDRTSQKACEVPTTFKPGQTVYWLREVDRHVSVVECMVVAFTPKRVTVSHDAGKSHVGPKSLYADRADLPALERRTTPLQDAVAELAFGLSPSEPVGKSTMIELNQIESDLEVEFTFVPDPEELRLAYEHYAKMNRGLPVPTRSASIGRMIRTYRRAARQRADYDTLPAVPTTTTAQQIALDSMYRTAQEQGEA